MSPQNIFLCFLSGHLFFSGVNYAISTEILKMRKENPAIILSSLLGSLFFISFIGYFTATTIIKKLEIINYKNNR